MTKRVAINGETTPPKKPGGATGKGFMPGQSGNPEGRPKGFSRLIRERTQDGATLYDETKKILGSAKTPPAVKLEAIKFLAAHAYGTPGQAQVEWDEDRVREAARALGKDPEQAIVALRAIRGEKSA